MTNKRITKQNAVTFPFFLFLVLLLLTWLSPRAFADVSLKDASYLRADTDQMAIKDASLDIDRHYNSRSLANGLFGFGWCSLLDVRVTPIGRGQVKLQDCGPDGANVSIEPLSDKLVFDGWSYTRTLADGTTQRFDVEGKITSIRRPSGTWLELRYTKGGTLTDLRSHTGLVAKVEIAAASGKIGRIAVSGGSERTYLYEGDDLVRTTSTLSRGKAVHQYEYRYDELHNLINAEGPKGYRETVEYDKSTDRVVTMLGSDGCTQSFTYTPSVDQPKERFSSRSVKKCGGRFISETKIEFQMRLATDGLRYLDRTIWTRGDDSLEIVYHPNSGLPVRISRNGRIIKETI